MRRVFFLLILVVASASTQAIGTPSPGKWRREVLLGANDSVFVTLVYSWDWPGSYYIASDTVAVSLRRNTDGALIREQRLWIRTRQSDVITGVYTVKEDSLGTFELSEYFRTYGLTPVPAEGQVYMRWDLDSTGVCFAAGDSIRETILSFRDLLSEHPELTGSRSTGLPRIAGVYAWQDKYYYVLISSGSADSPESDCYEEIVLLKGDRVDTARKKVMDRLWPNRTSWPNRR